MASTVAAILVTAAVTALRTLVSGRHRSRQREEAVQRVYAVTQMIARDIANAIRDEQLSASKVSVMDGNVMASDYDRDELLLFSRSRRRARPVPETSSDYQAEGGEYEVQYRLVPEGGDQGGVVWRRCDPIPDEYYDGGGVAVPIARGITSLEIDVFDGDEWTTEWESDDDGVPYAVRVLCRGLVEGSGQEVWATVAVALDRVPKPVWMIQDEPNFNLFGDPEGGGGEGLFGDDGGGDLFGDDGGGSGGGGGGGTGLFGGGG